MFVLHGAAPGVTPELDRVTLSRGRRVARCRMASLGDKQVEEMLFGDTDPRDVALFLAQQSLTMDPVERDQRTTILTALSIQSNRAVAAATQAMAEATDRMACWTRRAVLVAIISAFATSAIAVLALVLRR